MRTVYITMLILALGMPIATVLGKLCDQECVFGTACNSKTAVCLGKTAGAACNWCDEDQGADLCVYKAGKTCLLIGDQQNICGNMHSGICTGTPLGCVGAAIVGPCDRKNCTGTQ